MRYFALARLLPATILFATASLAVIPAPTHFFWMLSVCVTELGHLLALMCIGVAVPLWSNSWTGRVAVVLCAIAAVLAITPVLRAGRVAKDLPGQLNKAFGDAAPSRPPLVYAELFRGLTLPGIVPRTFIYAKVDDAEMLLDFYPAQTGAAAPVVVVIHGGSWRSGDNKEFIAMNRYLASRGFAVAAITYRLTPRWTFPAAADDVRAAIAFLRQRADSLKIDPNQIVLLGRSAGGQLALTVAYATNDAGIRGVISFYAPADLYWSWDNPGNPRVIDTRPILTSYLTGGPLDVSAKYDAASPIRFVNSNTPPTLLLHGSRDELVSYVQSVRLARRLAEVGVAHWNLQLPWATHGFDYFLRGPGGQISAYAVEHFLERVTHRGRS